MDTEEEEKINLSSTIPMILEGELWGWTCPEISYLKFCVRVGSAAVSIFTVWGACMLACPQGTISSHTH